MTDGVSGPLSADPVAMGAVPLLILGWLRSCWLGEATHSGTSGRAPRSSAYVVRASFITAALVGLACYLTNMPFSRGFVVLAFVLGTPLLLVERYLIRQFAHALRREGRLMHRVIAVGGPSGISEVVDALQRSSYVGYEVVGACLPDTSPSSRSASRCRSSAGSRTPRTCVMRWAPTRCWSRGVATPARQELRRIAWDLEGSSINLVVVPSLTDVAGPRIHMRPVAGLPLLHVEQPQAGKAVGWSKRAFDVVVASVLLFLLAPVLLAVAAVVKLQDGGPVFFRQTRVGRRGQTVLDEEVPVDEPGRREPARRAAGAERVGCRALQDQGRPAGDAGVGRIMRRYSIDELPQLFNVLRGEMSLVGPRPPLSTEVDQYADDVHRRLLVRPGLTGLWQISGRSSLSWDEAVRLDLFYVDNWSMTTDMVIMAKTVRAVLRATGAY